MSTASRPEGRTRAAHIGPEKRRPQVLDAARRLFSEQGFEATSIEQIADEIGVTKPVIYSCAPSKIALYKEVFSREQREMFRELDEQVFQSIDVTDPLSAVRRAYELIFERASQSPDSAHFIFAGHRGVPQEVSDDYDERMGIRITTIASWFESQFEDTSHSSASDKALVFAVSVVTNASAGSRMILSDPSRFDPIELANLMAHSVVDGVEGLRSA